MSEGSKKTHKSVEIAHSAAKQAGVDANKARCAAQSAADSLWQIEKILDELKALSSNLTDVRKEEVND